MTNYKNFYKSPIGNLIMISDGEYLTKLYIDNTNYNKISYEEKELTIFTDTKKWLDIYFSRHNPNFIPQYKVLKCTPFTHQVLEILKSVPYGETITYKKIAEIIAKQNGLKKMSAQAIGGALKRNPIWIIIPCHRVIGTNGKLTGYAGGLDAKIKLLNLESNKDIDCS